jgi:uncharacterized protein (DUF1684 family)
MTDISELRIAKDYFFKTDSQSPLNHSEQKTFRGLKYYPENPELRFTLPLETLKDPEHMVLTTSTGDEQEYFHVGQIRFRIHDQEAALQVYISASGGDYFIPFVDATAPGETYGGGRYLEPEEIGKGLLLVDFNLAYNPYCAYNDRWSCPIPPRANRISVRVEAGEMKFHE